MNKPKIVVIVGPTASGKTALSITLAKQFQGEVISADSRQVYRSLDIGTEKVTKTEMQGVPHHLLDVVDPGTVYTATDFRLDATKAIAGIHKRGALPIVAGGTFFYIDVLLQKITFPEVPPDETLRAELAGKRVGGHDVAVHRISGVASFGMRVNGTSDRFVGRKCADQYQLGIGCCSPNHGKVGMSSGDAGGDHRAMVTDLVRNFERQVDRTKIHEEFINLN